MEIERKYLVKELPRDYAGHPVHQIEQAYLCTEPVVRIRKQDDEYWLTCKSAGLLSREEYNLALTKEAFAHLLPKADGLVLKKKRYLIPLDDSGPTAELDVFAAEYEGLILVEVEFSSEAAAMAFIPPDWFGEEVTYLGRYSNSSLSRQKQNLSR